MQEATGVPFTRTPGRTARRWPATPTERRSMTSRPTVLLVEEDRNLRSGLLMALQGRGYEVVEAASGYQALAKTQEAPPHLMLLDLGLPDLDGVDVVVNLRRQHHFPIIALSARHAEEHQVRVLDAGADGYVTKPFREGELMARVRAALRHARGREYHELEIGDLRMDTVDHRVFLKNVEVKLTPIEFKLLHALLCESGRV